MRAIVRRTLGLAWVVPALVLVGVFVYLPLVQNLQFSTLEWDIYSGSREYIGFDNYRRLLDDPVFWSSFGNNLLYAVISIAVQVFGALVLAALIESIRSERWRRSLRAIYFVPSAISLTVAGLLFYFIYEPSLGPLNHLLRAVGLGSWPRRGWGRRAPR
nr:hypothetical protein GCM10020093_037490 [Planobispora longispora]